jgi:predicted metal-dependent phosphoesterase TrpH
VPRDAAPRADSPPWYRVPVERARPVLPLLPLIVTALLVLGSAAFARDPVRDAVSLDRIGEVSLRRPPAYVLLAPASDALDLLTLLSVRQHVALLLTLAAGYALWWWWRARHRPLPVTMPPARATVRLLARIGLALLAVISVYAAAMVLPRPMAALDVGPDVLAVDFHSHTRFSHDGRPDWGPEADRAWHRDAGFGAAYVSDHRSFEGARDGWANNPTFAGQGVSLLPAIEVVWRGEHVNVLDADRMYRGIIDPPLRDIDEDALKLASAVAGNEPVLVETLPGDLSRMIAAAGPGTAGVRAIELSDGAPAGLGQTRRERRRIIRLADSLNLAMVAGSNHHGWGHTAAAWTLMYLPGWRGATPEQLGSGIGTVIRRGGRGATKVAERYVADTESGIALPLTVPLVVWGMLRTLSTDERVVWLMWALAIFLVARVRRMRRTSHLAEQAR